MVFSGLLCFYLFSQIYVSLLSKFGVGWFFSFSHHSKPYTTWLRKSGLPPIALAADFSFLLLFSLRIANILLLCLCFIFKILLLLMTDIPSNLHSFPFVFGFPN